MDYDELTSAIERVIKQLENGAALNAKLVERLEAAHVQRRQLTRAMLDLQERVLTLEAHVVRLKVAAGLKEG